MHTKQTPARRDGALFRAVRAVGRWFSRVVNTIGLPDARPEADHWTDWPRGRPLDGLAAFPPILSADKGSRDDQL